MSRPKLKLRGAQSCQGGALDASLMLHSLGVLYESDDKSVSYLANRGVMRGSVGTFTSVQSSLLVDSPIHTKGLVTAGMINRSVLVRCTFGTTAYPFRMYGGWNYEVNCSSLIDCVFTNSADVTECVFHRGRLSCDFTMSRLQYCIFIECDLRGSRFHISINAAPLLFVNCRFDVTQESQLLWLPEPGKPLYKQGLDICTLRMRPWTKEDVDTNIRMREVFPKAWYQALPQTAYMPETHGGPPRIHWGH